MDEAGEGAWGGWRDRGWAEAGSRRETEVSALAMQLKDPAIPAVALVFCIHSGHRPIQ